jgi:ACS family hexuronate transporter-like MFS transporter
VLVPTPTAPGPSTASPVKSAGYFRWVICGLLFLATTINYIDRQVIGILKPTLQEEFAWTESDYADIVFAFQLAYAIGMVVAGRLMDRLGTKRGFALALTIWSLAAIAHAEAPVFGQWVALVLGMFGLGYSASVAGFMAARFALGLGESGNFPASVKTVAEWFPRRERALATGIFNAGTNVGALVTPLIVPWITLSFGWYWAFVATGAVGLLWLAIWLPLYATPDAHRRLKPAELAYIQSDPPDPPKRVPWIGLLPLRQTWAVALAKGLTDPIWWVYLFWIPDFLHRNHGLDLTTIGPPIVVIYLVTDVGSIGGGWLSSALIKRGWSVNAARKTAMLTFALAVVPIVFASQVKSMWLAVALISIAAASHQGWSANVYTLVSDMFPRHAVGSVVGFAGMAGAVGGMFISKIVGKILDATGSYVPIFLMAALAYLVALAVVQLLVPRLKPVEMGDGRTA